MEIPLVAVGDSRGAEDFDVKAKQSTIVVVNVGCVRARSGHIIISGNLCLGLNEFRATCSGQILQLRQHSLMFHNINWFMRNEENVSVFHNSSQVR